METSPEPSAIPEQQLPPCNVCQSYECKLKLPGEFPGTYLNQQALEVSGRLCILHYQDPNKDAEKCAAALQRKVAARDFNFRGVWFSCPVRLHGEMENANFWDATFAKAAYFGRATFSSAANFSQANFSGEANFHRATFNAEAYFGAATFSGEAHFIEATFSGEAHFRRARFSGAAGFIMATFSGAANFIGATFSGATFSGAGDFTLATFKEAGIFESLAKLRNEQYKATDRKVSLNFRQVRLHKPEEIRFHDVDMTEVSLLGPDVRKVEFTNVDWPEKLRDQKEAERGTKWWSLAKLKSPRQLWEARKEGKEAARVEYPLVEKLYRQLRQNYEDSGNYPAAGRFYYGEMEMRRKANPWRRFLPSLTTLYWISSGYGQRARQAGLWVVLLFVLFGWLYSMAGLQPAGVSSTVTHSLRAAFLYAGEVLTFARERAYRPATDWGRWLSVAQTVVLPAQVALLVLAVRRSFKR